MSLTVSRVSYGLSNRGLSPIIHYGQEVPLADLLIVGVPKGAMEIH
jgi:hypothetical protein